MQGGRKENKLTQVMEQEQIHVSSNHYQSDTLVWIAFRNGSQKDFSTIYYRYFNILLTKGLQICYDKELVKDCIHDLFVEMWKRKKNLSIPDSVKAYLLSSIQRKVLHQVKKARTLQNEIHGTLKEVVPCKEAQLIEEQGKVEQQYTVQKALNVLTRRQKEVIQLKFYNNLSYEEIGSRMSIKIDSIYNLVSKAINNLEHELKNEVRSKFC